MRIIDLDDTRTARVYFKQYNMWHFYFNLKEQNELKIKIVCSGRMIYYVGIIEHKIVYLICLS